MHTTEPSTRKSTDGPPPSNKRSFYADRSRRPVAPPVNPANIPDALKRIPHWVGWRFEWRENGDKSKWDKPPFQANGDLAKSNAPTTWGAFDAVFAAYQSGQHRFDGIGFELLNSGVVGVDLDDVIDPTTGLFTVPWAADLVERANTFADLSPSDCGVKLFGFGEWSAGWNRKRHPAGWCEIEVYTAQYFTVTGRPVGGSR
jgi:primase-polymerase (primpol)-like protein